MYGKVFTLAEICRIYGVSRSTVASRLKKGIPLEKAIKQNRRYLKNYNFHQLGSTSSIATAINSTYLKKMEIDLPPIDQQRAIAAVLSSIDDKIESNNAINNNLAA